MAGERRALLVATDAYTDPGLTRLRAPVGDVRALAEVLADPGIGNFDVHPLINQATDELKQEIEGFFDDARRQDLLVLYVSGHGVLSPTRRLYFATTTTRLKRLRATAIEDHFVHDVMQHSRARSIVLVLDCCHSGAFAHGLAPKSALGVDVEQRFEGQGRVILTASTALEYAFEETEADATISDLGAGAPGSLFTRYLVEGLKTGDADVDEDGAVSVDELYDYVYARVRERSPHQRPGKSGAAHGDIVIARTARLPTPPGEGPAEVRADVRRRAPVRRRRFVLAAAAAAAGLVAALIILATLTGTEHPGKSPTTPADPNGGPRANARVDGPPVRLRLDTPGQNGIVRFRGREGQRLSLYASPVAFGRDGAKSANITLVNPDNSFDPLAQGDVDARDGEVGNGSVKLPADGVYTITVRPDGAATGSLALRLRSG